MMLLKKPISKKFVMLSSMGADKPEEASQLQEYLHATMPTNI
jgi:hypothetical protein